MRKSFLLACLLLFFYVIAQGQSRIDSLHKVLTNIPQDTARIETLLELSFHYRNSNPDSTIYFAQQSLKLSKELKYPRGHAQSLRNIGLGYLRSGNIDTTIYLCNKALEVAKSANNKWAMANAYNTLGVAYFYKNDYDKAIDAFKQNAEAFEDLNQPEEVAGALTNIGSILENKGDFARALDNYQQALLKFEALNHNYGIATVSHNMASIFEDLNDYDKALNHYYTAIHYDSLGENISGVAGTLSSISSVQLHMGDTIKAIKNMYDALHTFQIAKAQCASVNTLSNLGDLYVELNQIDSAYKYAIKAVSQAKSCDNLTDLINAQNTLGKYYNAIGQYRQSIRELLKSYERANTEQLKPKMANAAHQLYFSYKQLDDLSNALKYLEINKALEDELFNSENTRRITQLEGEYNLEKEKQAFAYEQQINAVKFEKQLEKEQLLQRYTLIALGVFIVFLVIILILYIQKRKINKEVTLQNVQILEQNEEIKQQRDLLEERSRVVEEQKQALQYSNIELQELNNEKNTIIGIVAHDLKSPLNQIKGLLGLINMEKNEVSANTQDYLSKLQYTSEHAIQLIDRMLDINAIENKEIDIQKEPLDLGELVKHLVVSYQKEGVDKHIEIDCKIQTDSPGLITDKLLVREIIENILSNAIKFSPENSMINIKLEKLNGRLRLSIKDEGPGISAEDQAQMYNKYQKASAAPTAGEKSTGLGLAIVKRYVDALDYKIYCDSQPGHGTIFTLEMQ